MNFVVLPWPHKNLSPNARAHYHAVARSKKIYRADAAMLAKTAGLTAGKGEIPLTIEFHPPDHRHRDRDNMLASIKAGLDGIADAMGVNDRDFVPTIVRCEPVKDGKVVVSVG